MSQLRSASLPLALTTLVLGCTAPQSSDDEEAVGSTKKAGIVARVVIAVRDEAPGANCPLGGTALLSGQDDNVNFALDPDEVDDVEYICHGSDGADGATGQEGDDGYSTLISSSTAPIGGICAAGGTVLSWGRDTDRDGVLDEAEVEGSEYVCHGQAGAEGADGQAGVVDVIPLAPGAECTAGGVAVRYGIDDDGDMLLGVLEVEGAIVVCHGSDGTSALVDTRSEPMGSNCPYGGQRFDAGVDEDGDGSLDAAEIARTSYACNGGDGADGADGFDSLLSSNEEPVGAICAAGGSKLSWGRDLDRDGVLDAAEVEGAEYVCHGIAGANGQDGASALLDVTPLAPGPACLSGGTLVQSGLDANHDGVLSAGEVTGAIVICDGSDGAAALVATADEPAGESCSFGGQRVDVGTDVDGDGLLSAEETVRSAYVCNGADGQEGGTVLVRVVDLAAGAVCADGGALVQAGLDADQDGVLDPDEVTSEQAVCHGTSGAPLVRVEEELPGDMCEYGGQVTRVGVDSDGDGILSDAEVTSSAHMCQLPVIYTGDYTIQTQEDADALASTNLLEGSLYIKSAGMNEADIVPLSLDSLSRLMRVTTNVVIDHAGVTSLAGLRSLERVGASLVLAGTELHGLERLQAVGRDLDLIGGASSLEPLAALGSVGADIRVRDIDAVDLQGLEGLTHISGSLVIAHNQNLTSLTGLDGLTRIEGTLNIGKNPVLTTLAGLEALTTVAKTGFPNLSIGSNGSLQSVSSLSSLTTAAIDIFDNASLPKVEGLGSFAGSLDSSLSIRDNPQLTRIGPLGSQGALHTLSVARNEDLVDLIGVDFSTIKNLRIQANPQLVSLTGFSSLSAAEYISVEGSAALTSLEGLGGVGELVNLSIVDNDALVDLAGLQLTSIHYNLAIARNAALTSLTGLESASFASVSIVGNPALTSLEGLSGPTGFLSIFISDNDALQSVNGLPPVPAKTVTFRSNDALVDLTALGAMGPIQRLTIEQSSALTSLSTLGALTVHDLSLRYNQSLAEIEAPLDVDGTLSIRDCNALVDLAGLENVTNLTSLKVALNLSLTSLTGLGGLHTVNQEVFLSRNSALTSLQGLQALTDAGAVTVLNNPVLQTLSGLDALTSAGGVIVRDNASLTTLAGLDNLQSLTWARGSGDLIVESNAALTTLGLPALSVKDGSMYVRSNTALSECQPIALHDRLIAEGFGHATYINGNLYCEGTCSDGMCVVP